MSEKRPADGPVQGWGGPGLASGDHAELAEVHDRKPAIIRSGHHVVRRGDVITNYASWA